MNTNTLKVLTVAISLAGGIGASSSAMATLTPGVQTLGAAQNSVDVWAFTCPVLFPRGRATVQDLLIPFSVPNQLQVALGQGALPVSQATDNSPAIVVGEGGLTSLPAVVNGAAGVSYYAVFKKTAVGVEAYSGDLYCTNIIGLRINPVVTRVFNQ